MILQLINIVNIYIAIFIIFSQKRRKYYTKCNISLMITYFNSFYESIVDIVSVVSSNTSRSTFTVSSAVKIVMLFSVATLLI